VQEKRLVSTHLASHEKKNTSSFSPCPPDPKRNKKKADGEGDAIADSRKEKRKKKAPGSPWRTRMMKQQGTVTWRICTWRTTILIHFTQRN
jgi:hypothetical protein